MSNSTKLIKGLNKAKFIDDSPELQRISAQFKEDMDALFMNYLEEHAKLEEDEFYLTQHLCMSGVEKFTQLFFIIMLKFSGKGTIEIAQAVDQHVNNVVRKMAEEGGQSPVIVSVNTSGIKGLN